MKKILSILGLTLAFVLIPFGQGVALAQEEVVDEEVVEVIVDEVVELSLEDAIKYGMENNKEIEIAKLELEKAEIGYSDDIRGVRLLEDGMRVEQLDNPVTYLPYDEPSVFNNMARNGIARMTVELALNSAKWNVETKQNQVKYNIEKAYFDLLQTEKELNIAEENLALSQKQFNNGKLRLDVGMISQQQLLGLEFNLSQAQSGHESARMYYGLQKMSFRNTLGLDLNQEFALTDIIEFKEYDEIILEDSIKEANENNSNIKLAEASLEIQENTLKSISGRYPEITFRYREQAVEVAKAEGNLKTAKVGVEMQVRSAILNLTTAEKQIATYEKAVYQASEGVRIAELSFELGQNTPTEVAQANLNLMNAKKNLAQQIHAFNTALLDYKYSVGIGKGM